MINVNLPVACSLSGSELQERRRDVLQRVKDVVAEVRELEDGFLYRFSPEARFAELASLVELEHQCCPFLAFRITVEPGAGPISLELTGPPGTKDFLKELFA
ncbi:MAG: hypothetical protein ACREBG_26350 [Pyrinomonadaceae bacterium]